MSIFVFLLNFVFTYYTLLYIRSYLSNRKHEAPDVLNCTQHRAIMTVFTFPVTSYTENKNYFVFLFSVSGQVLRNLFLSSTSRASLNIHRWSWELQTWPTPFLAIMEQLACPGHVDSTLIEQKHIVIWKLNMKHLSHAHTHTLSESIKY
jgi:hypothetical protein